MIIPHNYVIPVRKRTGIPGVVFKEVGNPRKIIQVHIDQWALILYSSRFQSQDSLSFKMLWLHGNPAPAGAGNLTNYNGLCITPAMQVFCQQGGLLPWKGNQQPS